MGQATYGATKAAANLVKVLDVVPRWLGLDEGGRGARDWADGCGIVHCGDFRAHRWAAKGWSSGRFWKYEARKDGMPWTFRRIDLGYTSINAIATLQALNVALD
ncbi:hypothetical protein C8R45DRAFT_1096893 [Mycena sanguinolenta]|nr:hypothetical protein C8R45DRAFT_1096893 [Mycena sanguinolenta]